MNDRKPRPDHIVNILISFSESNIKSQLHYGPLQRHHHNNVLSCEAKNNNQVAPVAKKLSINMICKSIYNLTYLEIYQIDMPKKYSSEVSFLLGVNNAVLKSNIK